MFNVRAMVGWRYGIGLTILLLVVAPGTCVAQCGDYVHYGEQPTEPRCEQVPPPAPAPMPTEGHVVGDDWATVIIISDPISTTPTVGWVWQALQPQFVTEAIFHPPRCTT